jgi:(4-alkanoyl-5-oxo-2,5-dihydrofuran-3-yl)methyl phosphate reductase
MMARSGIGPRTVMEVRMEYLVTGATGNIGGRVVDRLLAQGARPRIFARDAGKARERYGDRVDVALGDLADPASLLPALDRIDVLFLATSGADLAAADEAAARAAASAGTRLLVKLSTYDVTQQVGTGVWHAAGEAAIQASGIGFTFVQPSGYMDNFLNWATSIRSEMVVRSATAGGRIPFIHSDDIADVVVACMTVPGYEGQSLPITGPEALSFAEMTAKLSATIGKPLRFEAISEEEARRQQAAWGTPPPLTEARLSIFRAIREGRLAEVTTEVERVLGRKPITFGQWAQDNAPAFA